MIPDSLLDIDTSDENTESNYPTEQDTPFTPDEIDSIKRYKDNLNRKLEKNRSILKGLEVSFWGITSYSLARFLIITSGSQGIFLAVALVLTINQIVNRDLLEFNINKTNEGWELTNMDRLVKFIFQLILACFIIWGGIGNYFNTVRNSEQTYNDIKNTVENFNQLPQSDKTAIFVVAIIVISGASYVIISDKRRL
jgi:hypothetical protein